VRLISSSKAKNSRINIYPMFSYWCYHWPDFHWSVNTTVCWCVSSLRYENQFSLVHPTAQSFLTSPYALSMKDILHPSLFDNAVNSYKLKANQVDALASGLKMHVSLLDAKWKRNQANCPQTPCRIWWCIVI